MPTAPMTTPAIWCRANCPGPSCTIPKRRPGASRRWCGRGRSSANRANASRSRSTRSACTATTPRRCAWRRWCASDWRPPASPSAPWPSASEDRSARLFGVLVLQDLAGDAEAFERRRHAAIDRRLQQDLLDLFARDAVVERAADVQAHLVRPIEGGQHRQVYEAARLLVEPGPVPDLAPAPFGDELLERLGEGVGILDRAVDIFGAEHRPPHRQALVVKRALGHRVPPSSKSRHYAACARR